MELPVNWVKGRVGTKWCVNVFGLLHYRVRMELTLGCTCVEQRRPNCANFSSQMRKENTGMRNTLTWALSFIICCLINDQCAMCEENNDVKIHLPNSEAIQYNSRYFVLVIDS